MTPGEADLLVEGLGYVGGGLARHGVRDEEGFDGFTASRTAGARP